MDRKKELKEQYKQMKLPMGVIWIRFEKQCFLDAAVNLNGCINSSKFKLKMGNHPNKNLQKCWNENNGENSKFIVEILDELSYDNKDAVDCKEDLIELKEIWTQKVIEQGYTLF